MCACVNVSPFLITKDSHGLFYPFAEGPHAGTHKPSHGTYEITCDNTEEQLKGSSRNSVSALYVLHVTFDLCK